MSVEFIQDWLAALEKVSPVEAYQRYLQQAGLGAAAGRRVSRDQIVHLYQLAAVGCGDEMMGLWKRPIRAGALKHLLTTMRDASSIPAALYRFTTFWNLLLDDYQLDLREGAGGLTLVLLPRGGQKVDRFGHMLMLKLTHGLLSWLAGQELPVKALEFAFPTPVFAADYAVLFPARARFSAPLSSISFATGALSGGVPRSDEALLTFLQNAPRDWIFTGLEHHSVSLQVRAFLASRPLDQASLETAAAEFGLTARTLMRRLAREGTTFQEVKDGLRRDLALRGLLEGGLTVEEVSQDLGFSSPANFHRAFRRWTGTTPGQVRRRSLEHGAP